MGKKLARDINHSSGSTRSTSASEKTMEYIGVHGLLHTFWLHSAVVQTSVSKVTLSRHAPYQNLKADWERRYIAGTSFKAPHCDL